jgi:hypothetical protein
MLFPEIEARLVELGRLPDAVLSAQEREWYDEFVNVGEYGLALEMLADWLSEDERPISAAFRSEALTLAGAMEIAERVGGALAFCPDRADGPGTAV